MRRLLCLLCLAVALPVAFASVAVASEPSAVGGFTPAPPRVVALEGELPGTTVELEGTIALPAASSCGGAGEVPCLTWDWCAWRGAFNECWGGFVPDGPYNGCNSDRLSNWGLVCVACGSTGQPVCTQGPSCNQPPNGTQRHTAAGLCYACGGSGQPACLSGPRCDEGYREVLGFCAYSGFSQEPTTNSTVAVPVQASTGSLYGFSNLHTHQFANLGFGGVLFWGAPFDWGGINSALAWCDYTWDFAIINHLGVPNPPVLTLGYEVHGPEGFNALGDPVETAIGVGSHKVGGTGPFDGWPAYNQVTHQQMYYKWVQRAYQGGLRLMVMDAVSNEILCRGGKHREGWNCNDMDNADRQIQGAKDLEYYVDFVDDNTINGSGWYRIAYSAQQARDLVRAGKMAVVLGIEVDTLFNCAQSAAGCTEAHVSGELQRYYNLGVRHVFPIHEFDNAFGGSALFNNLFNKGNFITAGHYFDTWNCQAENPAYTYNIEADALGEILGFLLFGVVTPPPSYGDPSECNARGLTPLGDFAVRAMMDRKMIIDVDHMSRRMKTSVLDIAEERSYPLVASHAGILGLTSNNEFAVTDAEITRLRDLGGIVAPGVPRGQCGTSEDYPEALRYLSSRMTGGSFWTGADGVIGIGISTDTNGSTQQTAPRFGPAAAGCPSAIPALVYPFPAQDGSGSFSRQVTGGRTFDYNFDGMAHFGLLPDFLADLRQRGGTGPGLTPAEIDPVFKSAEAFIRMWERIDSGHLEPPPVITPVVTGALGANGWYTSDVNVTWTITTNAEELPVTTGCNATTISSDTRGMTLTCRATNADGGQTSASVTIKRDATRPIVTATRLTPANGNGWNNGPVSVRFDATDATSGLTATVSQTITLASEGANQIARVTFSDQAGLTFEGTLANINIDRTPPTLGFRFSTLPRSATPFEIQAEQARWHNTDVVLVVDARDTMSGIDTIAPSSITLTTEGTDNRGSATATDKAGNSVTQSSDPVKIDKTPPSIAFVSRLPAANGHGWNKTDVTVAWSCADTRSGVVAASVSRVVSAEGAAQTATGECADNAGNTASHDEGSINIDKTAPVITTGAAPAANAAGWNNTDVTVTFAATDALSGVDGPATQAVVLAAEGTGLGATRGFTDKAGNASAATADGFKIDKTKPALVFGAPSPGANAAGWNNTNVAFAFTTSDALSGVAGTSVPSPLVLGSEGAAVTGSVTVADVAGNEETFTSPAVRIDKTPPVVQCTAAPGVLWAPNHKLQAIEVAFTFTDALSGAATYALHTAAINEPDTGGDIDGFAIGGTMLSGSLRAERAGTGAGRVYTLGYRGVDFAGNAATCSTPVVVPHDQGDDSGR